jgi:acetyl/propionyl-CoA carboxylase alpha subunit
MSGEMHEGSSRRSTCMRETATAGTRGVGRHASPQLPLSSVRAGLRVATATMKAMKIEADVTAPKAGYVARVVGSETAQVERSDLSDDNQ